MALLGSAGAGLSDAIGDKPATSESPKSEEAAGGSAEAGEPAAEDIKLDPGQWKPVMDMDEQLFASFVVATATQKWESSAKDFVGDAGGLMGVVVRPAKDDEKIKVTIEENDLIKTSTWEGKLPKADHNTYVYPKVDYKFSELLKVRQVMPLNVRFTVQLGDAPPKTETLTIQVRPINDCPFTMAEGSDTAGFDMNFMFAAYVNENHPWIDKILKEALQTGIVGSFDGYQSGDPSRVLAQVYAIWYTLSKRDVRYSSITATAGNSDSVYSQTMRFLDECIGNSQANCADGSVLLASILRKIDIEPYLVLVPGHMYLAFDGNAADSEEGSDPIGLETTLIGAANLEGVKPPQVLLDAIPEKFHQEPSFLTFCAAVMVGTKNLQENEENFADESKWQYVLMSVDDARADDIMPIPYVRNPDAAPPK